MKYDVYEWPDRDEIPEDLFETHSDNPPLSALAPYLEKIGTKTVDIKDVKDLDAVVKAFPELDFGGGSWLTEEGHGAYTVTIWKVPSLLLVPAGKPLSDFKHSPLSLASVEKVPPKSYRLEWFEEEIDGHEGWSLEVGNYYATMLKMNPADEGSWWLTIVNLISNGDVIDQKNLDLDEAKQMADKFLFEDKGL
jgi:hypothetical protein